MHGNGCEPGERKKATLEKRRQGVKKLTLIEFNFCEQDKQVRRIRWETRYDLLRCPIKDTSPSEDVAGDADKCDLDDGLNE
jgi:hypothetical protein